MKQLSRVLCVVDPISSEQRAVERAAWVCRKAGAKLDLLICYFNESLSGAVIFDAPALDDARREIMDGHVRRLEDLAKPLRESGLEVVTKVLWDRPLHEGIIRYAASIDANLVFKDTHHHSPVSRAFLSNSDWQLIRTCASPLWLVKPVPVSDRPVFLSAIDPMNEHDKPAALDDEIISCSRMFATLFDGEMHVFHAYDPRIALESETAIRYMSVPVPYDQIGEEMRKNHEKRFREITEYYGIEDKRTHLVAGRTEDALPALAARLDATVVVMGAIARNRWKRMFIGATAERTMDHLPCDLLVVKPDWFHIPDEILKHGE